MCQFWGEALLQGLVAMCLGVVFAELALPAFNALVQKELVLTLNASMGIGLAVALVPLALAAGAYPAAVLSGFRPVAALRDRLKLGKGSWLGRGLVVLQFGLSVFLVAVTLAMWQQLELLQDQALGAHDEKVVVVRASQPFGREDSRWEVYKKEISRHPNVLSASGSSWYFEEGISRWGSRQKGERVLIRAARIDYEYLPTLGIRLVQGRNYSRDVPSDVRHAVVVNEALVRELGWDTGLGETLKGVSRNRTVIGVVKDYHFRTLRHPIAPLALCLDVESVSNILVRIGSGDVVSTLAVLEEKWGEVVPDQPFRFSFLDDDLARHYAGEMRWGKIVRYAAAFAVLISCLGVFGLTALAVSRRAREVGIRRVFGATVSGVLALFSREFIVLGMAGGALAWPAIHYAVGRWLEGFAYRIDVGVAPFALGSALTLVTVVVTVCAQAAKVALSSPVDALREA